MSDQSNITPGEPITYMGLDVQDEHGDTIGSVSDVLYDESTQNPQWLVVNPGTLRADHFVPTERRSRRHVGGVLRDEQLRPPAQRGLRDHRVAPDEAKSARAASLRS